MGDWSTMGTGECQNADDRMDILVATQIGWMGTLLCQYLRWKQLHRGHFIHLPIICVFPSLVTP
jgi:hypothetical protein